MSTLRQMNEEGWGITFYCLSLEGPYCFHSWRPSWDQLIQYFGQDLDLVIDRRPLSKLVCEMCGGRGASVIVQPPDYIVGRGGGGHRNPPEPLSDAEIARRRAEFEADFRARGFRTNAEIAQESKLRIRAEKRAAKGGAGLIGPPDPRAHRKRRKPS